MFLPYMPICMYVMYVRPLICMLLHLIPLDEWCTYKFMKNENDVIFLATHPHQPTTSVIHMDGSPPLTTTTTTNRRHSHTSSYDGKPSQVESNNYNIVIIKMTTSRCCNEDDDDDQLYPRLSAQHESVIDNKVRPMLMMIFFLWHVGCF